MNQCDCCLRTDQPMAGVACSSLGAISMAYCKPCAIAYAEPKELIQFTIDDCGGLDQVNPDLLDTVTYYEDGKYIKMRDFK